MAAAFMDYWYQCNYVEDEMSQRRKDPLSQFYCTENVDCFVAFLRRIISLVYCRDFSFTFSLSVGDDTFPRRGCMLHVEIVLKTKQPEAETSLVYDVFLRVIRIERAS